jgi:hypothetical protein
MTSVSAIENRAGDIIEEQKTSFGNSKLSTSSLPNRKIPKQIFILPQPARAGSRSREIVL